MIKKSVTYYPAGRLFWLIFRRFFKCEDFLKKKILGCPFLQIFFIYYLFFQLIIILLSNWCSNSNSGVLPLDWNDRNWARSDSQASFSCLSVLFCFFFGKGKAGIRILVHSISVFEFSLSLCFETWGCGVALATPSCGGHGLLSSVYSTQVIIVFTPEKTNCKLKQKNNNNNRLNCDWITLNSSFESTFLICKLNWYINNK